MQEREERYLRIRDAEQKLETRALTSLGHFLTANAFMIVGWVTLFGEMEGNLGWALDVVLVLVAFVGCSWGVMWARRGARDWEYARRLVAALHRIGAQIPEPTENLYQIFVRAEDATQRKRGVLHSYPSILTLAPLSVSEIYVALWLLWAHDRSLARLETQYWPVIVAAFVATCVAYQWVRCRESEDESEAEVQAARGRHTENPK